MNDLSIKLNASFAGLVGYGEVYRCEVLKVIQGQLEDDSIMLTVLHSDKDYAALLSKNQAPETLEISFTMKEENAKYSLMPISGMVDTNKTMWTIQEIKKSK